MNQPTTTHELLAAAVVLAQEYDAPSPSVAAIRAVEERLVAIALRAGRALRSSEPGAE